MAGLVLGLIWRIILIHQIICDLDVLSWISRRSLASANQLDCLSDGSHHSIHKNSFLWTLDKIAIPDVEADVENLRQPKQLSNNYSARSYFFGTIHVPFSKVWDHVSPATKKAFDEADHVIFELDLRNRKTVRALADCQLLPDGQELSKILPGDLFVRLRRHLKYIRRMIPSWVAVEKQGDGFYAQQIFDSITKNWQHKRPVWTMLMLNTLTEYDIKSRGIPVLDLHLAYEAEKLQKLTGAVEHPEEQCLPLNNMKLSQVIFALNHSLHQLEMVRKGTWTDPSITATNDLIYHYNCGDLDSVIFKRDTSQIASLSWEDDTVEGQAVDEYFRTELIEKRNRRMAKRVVQLLEAFPRRKFFFAFGAGHFLGNHSVITFVKEMGYNITHLPANHQIKSTRFGELLFNEEEVHLAPWERPRWSAADNERFLLDSDDQLSNSRSHYLDHRGGYRRTRKRKPSSRVNPEKIHLARQRTSPLPGIANRNFNELWATESSIPEDDPAKRRRLPSIPKNGSSISSQYCVGDFLRLLIKCFLIWKFNYLMCGT